MKITLKTDLLQNKLSITNRAISTKTSLPILSNILLSAYNGMLQLSSTDLEVGIEAVIPVEVIEEGAITLPSRLFTELIHSLPQESLEVKTEGLTCEIKSKKSKSTMQGMSADEFPKLYEDKGEKIADIPVSDLKKYFSSVIFAASQDIARPALSGILVQPEEKGFLLVATDGYRLSLKHHTLSVETAVQDTQTILIPARVFREVISLKEEGDIVSFFVSRAQNQVLFTQGQTTIVGRLIEAQFPTYEKIIPSDFSVASTFDREELLKAVKICSLFARDSANIIRLSLQKDKIVVSSQTPSLGENTVEVEAVLSGEENDIAFNARYLLDILSNVEDETMILEMTGPLNPGVFKIKDDPSFLHLIMPIRIQQ